ncbi:MAG: hypothetical protein U0Q22_11430 [Acidimicrobiales bacterium]
MTSHQHPSRSYRAPSVAIVALLCALATGGCGTDSTVTTSAAPASVADPLVPFVHDGPYHAELRVTEDVGELTTSLVTVDYENPESWTVTYRSDDSTGQRDGTRFVRTPGNWVWTQPSYNLSAVVTPEQQLQVDKALTPDQWGPLVDQMIADGRIPLTDQVLGSEQKLPASAHAVPGDFALLSLFRPTDRRGFWLREKLSVSPTDDGYTVTTDGIRMEYDRDGEPVRSSTVGDGARKSDVQVLSIEHG